MHSRIFQLTKEKCEPIDDVYYDYEHWFTGSIADYVMNSNDREGDISWLLSYSNGALKRKGDKIIVADKAKYFEDKYKSFIKGLEKLSNASFEDFQKPFNIYSLESLVENKYGFYIEDCGEWGGLTTFDEFMRRVENSDEFYIGATLDYHC